jgi:hypothetical protein
MVGWRGHALVTGFQFDKSPLGHLSGRHQTNIFCRRLYNSVGHRIGVVEMNDKTRRLTPEEATFKAFECREMAKRADSEAHRTMLEHMAATWDRIAAEMSEKKQDGKP